MNDDPRQRLADLIQDAEDDRTADRINARLRAGANLPPELQGQWVSMDEPDD